MFIKFQTRRGTVVTVPIQNINLLGQHDAAWFAVSTNHDNENYWSVDEETYNKISKLIESEGVYNLLCKA